MSETPLQVLEATESFVCELGGERYTIHQGMTRVAASHALVKAYPDRFRSVEEGLSYPESETTTAAPGERRARPVRTDKAEATA